MLEFSLKKLRVFNFFLLALLIAASLFLVRNILTSSFPKRGVSAGHQGGTGEMADRGKKSLLSYSAILERNPFGSPLKLFPLRQAPTEAREYGQLSSLHLLGTAVSPDNEGYAVFRDAAQGGLQDVFTGGDDVFGYGTLRGITPFSADIEQNGVIHTVPFHSESAKNDSISLQQNAARSSDTFVRQVGERDYILDSRKVQQSLQNPEHLLTDARLLPNFIEGKQEGFTISEVEPDGLYHSLGLRNGDILLRVNGLEISNPEVAMQAMTALRGMNSVNLDIIRGGEKLSLNYRIR